MSLQVHEQKSPSSVDEAVRPPKQYKVLLHNDDYSTMDFVVEVLMRIFKKSKNEAVEIMLAVHTHQVGVCGIYTYEIAETKVGQVLTLAKANSFPLRCTMEEA